MLTFVGQRVYGLCFYVKKMSSIGFSERPLYWCLIVLALNFCGTIFYSSIIFFFLSLFKPKNWQSWISIKTLKVSLFQEKKSVTLNCMWATYLLHELLWGIFAVLSKCAVAFPWMYCIFISFISLIGTLLCSLVVLFWF